MDKDVLFMIFEVLYWLGVRSGEALALTPADFDLKRGRVSITKTYHRIDGEDVTIPPKTRKSNRVIVLPRSSSTRSRTTCWPIQPSGQPTGCSPLPRTTCATR